MGNLKYPPSRREALAALLAAGVAHAGASLDAFMDGERGCALLVDIPGRRLIAAHRLEVAAAELNPPGSTVKPLVLAALLGAGKLGPEEAFPCPGRLTIAGEPFPCSHPPVPTPIVPRTALAYSCNCYVAHFAQRFAPGELARYLERSGIASPAGWLGGGAASAAGSIQPAAAGAPSQLQALGERRVAVTVAGLAMAYRSLAMGAAPVILEGLEDAVEYGTAQRAAVPRLQIAGKTGSLRTESGKLVAWFAGFAPSRAPRVVVAVMLQARSGGGDAAPVAGRILAAWQAGRL
ncbi:MAG TPA: penicillin-binding transpeptidase domain-containing protein [Bryobacteraceae bacterium]|nr:penicillin-binding transpeptidase domain-containing protein [Bryobacteraceae bacterium]